jgi:Flp pilus assembly pilin Flp
MRPGDFPAIDARRIWRNRTGVAAVEFALIAPLMVLLLFGVVEVSELLNTNRRVENTAASIADVVARDTIVDDDDIDDLWAAIDPLMYPEAAGPMKVRVTSVLITSATEAEVGWSKGHNGFAGLAKGAAFSLPAGLMVPDTSIIVAEVSYAYTPAINVVLGNALTLAHKEYRRPRVVDPITYDD